MKIDWQGREINIDKKYLMIAAVLIIVCLVLLLIPKNKSVLMECTANKSDMFFVTEEKYVATFKSDKLDKLVISVKNNLTDNYIHMLDVLYEDYEEQLKNLKNNGGYDYKIEKGSNFISFESTVNLNKIPDSTKTLVGFNNEWNYEDFKKNLEDNDFTCK